MKGITWFSRARRLSAGAVLMAMLLLVGAVAYAGGSGPATPQFTPQKADQITNIDILRSQIKNYYGDPSGSGIFAPDSNYAMEAGAVAAAGERWLRAQAGKSDKQAIVLDVDDTTLTTWNYEIFSNWAYNPTSNATYVNGELFPATPGMVAMVNWAADHGYAVFFITGRPTSQYDTTLGNLTDSDTIGLDAGYPTPEALFTKPTVGSYPDYLDTPEFCAAAIDAGKSCATIPYKAGTRAYIEETLGYDIVADFGDQYSDLRGGYADKTFKMPNPNYYLP